MKLVNVGSFKCKYCNKDIAANVYSDNPEILDYKEDVIEYAKNFHWYDIHYNCAVCGKLIPSGERELIFEESYRGEIHLNYHTTSRAGLLRVHKACAVSLS